MGDIPIDKVEENITAEINYVIHNIGWQQGGTLPGGEVFTEREFKELSFAINYARHYAHGTTGHNQLMLISKLFEHLSKALTANLGDINDAAD